MIQNSVKADSAPTRYAPYADASLNRYDRRTLNRSVNIDSTFRANYDSTSASDFVYHMPDTIEKVMSMKLSAIQLPPIYPIDTRNNTFTITIDGNSFLITIPVGAPTLEDVTNAITDAFKSTVFSVSVTSTEIGKMSINFSTNLGEAQATISFIPTTCDSSPFRTAGWYMGYRHNTYTGSTISAEAPFGGNVGYVFLEIDDYNRNYPPNTLISTSTRNMGTKPSPSAATSYIGTNVLGRIVVVPDSATAIVDSTHLSQPRDYFGPVRLDKIRIRLIDKYGYTVDLNNNDFVFVLDFVCIY